MRKRLIGPASDRVRPHDEGWLDVDAAAVVEVTSEEEDYPIESALLLRETGGWQAASRGTQTIRLEHTAEVTVPAAKGKLENPKQRSHQSRARWRRSQLPLASSHSSRERT